MRLVIKYAYTARVEDRGGNITDQSFGDELEVVTPEVAAEEAPVVLRHRGWEPKLENYWREDWEGHQHGLVRWQPARDARADIRAWNGALYEPVRAYRNATEEDGNPDWKVAYFGQDDEGKAGYAFSDLACVKKRWESDLTGKSLKTTKSSLRMTDDVAQKTGDEVRALARGLVAIDGKLYRKFPEPVFVVGASRHDYGRTTTVPVELQPEGRWRNDGRHCFRLDEAADMRAMAGLLYGENGLNDADRAISEFELLDPAGLSLDLKATELTHAARHLTEAVARDLDTHPRDVMLAWDDLRTVLSPEYGERERRRKEGYDEVGSAVDAMRALIDACEARFGVKGPGVEEARLALAAFERRGGLNRPIEEDLEALASIAP